MTAPLVAPLVELQNVSKFFGSVIALQGVSFAVEPGEIHCLLGDNGAGKSTLIKVLSGVHQPSSGAIVLDGTPVTLHSPKDALDRGIATVFQDLALIPLMSVARNFFLGREPTRGRGPARRFDVAAAGSETTAALARMGIRLRSPDQAVGTLSGGERQCVAIARAVHFGARVLILDEPTSALGVHQASIVLKTVAEAAARGIGVVFISHNVSHAFAVGDRFTLLNRGQSLGTHVKSGINREQLISMMAGGRELADLEGELQRLRQQRSVAS